MFTHLEVTRNGFPEVPYAMLWMSLSLRLNCKSHVFKDFTFTVCRLQVMQLLRLYCKLHMFEHRVASIIPPTKLELNLDFV